MNAEMIRDKISFEERTKRLNKMAIDQMKTFLKNRNALKKIKKESILHSKK